MNVLVACEKSGVVRDAFRALGHDARSCDTEPDEHASEFHFQCDVQRLLYLGSWDLLIAHPPCTFLSSSGLHWNIRRPERAEKTAMALEFVRELDAAPIPRRCFENPVGAIYRALPGAFVQWVQPYEFGHDASKRTGLSLRNLPPLVKDSALFVAPRMVCCGLVLDDAVGVRGCPNCCGDKRAKPRWANQTDSGQNRLGPSPTRAADRARTYAGIARAMADQWGRLS